MTPRELSDYSDMLTRIYRHCQAARGPRVGRPYMTWVADLRAYEVRVQVGPQTVPQKLERLTYTSFMNERREVTGSLFEFRFPLRAETFAVSDRIEFTPLQLCVDGSEFERIFPVELSESVAEEQWDRYGQGVTAEVGRHYDAVLYPRVVETLRKIAARRGAPLHVADLGGGDGRLAARVVDELPEVARATVVERSPDLLEAARAHAAGKAGRMTVVAADLLVDPFWDRLERPLDVVVACGVVAQQVLDHADGLVLAQRIFGELAPGGFVVLPSYSPALLASPAYEGIGFAVRNKTCSFLEEGSAAVRTNDFYVLEKPVAG